MKLFASLLFRTGLVAVCCFATWTSVRHARADIAASRGTADGLKRALQIEPENVELVVSDALLRGDSDDPSAAADEPLLRALRMDPLNSRLLIALGLRAEFRGDNAAAEQYLERAAQADHAFLPAWTLANFFVRAGQPDKFWPLAGHCLNLDPLLIDPRPVFSLAWRVTSDPAKVRSIIPQAGPRLVDYFRYLMDTNRTDPAVELWPQTLDTLDPSRPADVGVALAYCDFLARSNREPNAVRAWNQLVERNFFASGRLDPATGVSITDPDFKFPPVKGLFGWHLAAADGVYVSSGASALRFELDGNQPEAFTLLSTTAAVLPARAYRLRWNDDASELSAPGDPGFETRILQQPGNAVTLCGPLLKAEGQGACSFTTGPEIQRAGIEVRYSRAPGTTRPHGTLALSEIRLEFAK